MTWDVLREARRQGMRPELPVYVTDRWPLVRNMADCGCIAILHKRGEPMPVKLLDGLDVRLDFGKCETAGRVKRLMDARDVQPAKLRAWCNCARDFVAVCGPCDDGSEPWADR
jgi:hypothetical protein